MVKNLHAKNMGQNSNKILTFLKSSDSVNIDLAVTLIGEHMLESNWIPWLLLNKGNENVRELLKSNNIKRCLCLLFNKKLLLFKFIFNPSVFLPIKILLFNIFTHEQLKVLLLFLIITLIDTVTTVKVF